LTAIVEVDVAVDVEAIVEVDVALRVRSSSSRRGATGSSGKVNEGVDVTVAVDVNGGVEVIVEDKVSGSPCARPGLARRHDLALRHGFALRGGLALGGLRRRGCGPGGITGSSERGELGGGDGLGALVDPGAEHVERRRGAGFEGGADQPALPRP
jgi:hypothetical protein